jgi:glutamate dehydrogenase (NAD(P)+)
MSSDPIIHRNFLIGDTTFALVVQTFHGDTVATTAVHRQDFPRHIGGARCVLRRDGTDDGLTEVAHLSSTMTEKCIAAMIPADGQKTVVVTSQEVIDSLERRVEILAEHERCVAALDPGVIFGPDMEVGEDVQDALAALDGLYDHVTGLSAECRGLSIDKNGYTAVGVVEAVRAFRGGDSLEGATVTVQGFGAVGAHTAHLLHDLGARVRAISNKLGMLAATGDGRLDIPKIFALWEAHEDDCLRLWHEQSRGATRLEADADALFEIPGSIFIPAARTSVLAMSEELEEIRRGENARVRDIAEFLDRTGVELIAEGANHPLSEEAQRFSQERGVAVLPDFIINCGGLIGCWVEWEARHTSFTGDLSEVGIRAQERVRATVRANVKELRGSRLPARDAAEQIVRRNRQKLMESGGLAV